MESKNHNITGIILAGGNSIRMGTQKGLVEFNDRPMISYAIDAMKPVCTQILISANSAGYEHFGYQVIPDDIPGSGPMGGIWSCMKLSENELCFVLSCDMPLINNGLIRAIISQSRDYDLAVPWHGGNRFEPLCAVYRKTLLPQFESFIRQGNFRIPDLINKVNSRKIEAGKEIIPHPQVFFNVNSPEELEQLSKKISGINKTENRKLPEIPNLMLIAGTGRKVGKTTFACRIIGQVSETHPVTAVKISPHLHRQHPGQKIVAETNDWIIIEETNTQGTKDSSRMLRAGAKRVFYLQTRDRNINKPFRLLLNLIPENHPVVCESGALLSQARPGLFLLISRKGETIFKKGLDQLRYSPDQKLQFDGEGFLPDPESIVFGKRCWKILNT